jgi:hypothetical protein
MIHSDGEWSFSIDDAAFPLARVKRFKMLLNVELAGLKKACRPVKADAGPPDLRYRGDCAG